MSRWLAGTFDIRGDTAHLRHALDPEQSSVLGLDALDIAYTGSATLSTAPLCLLDGFIDNEADLRSMLEVEHDLSTEQLLAAGYRRWGAGLPAQLRGDFALVLWDRERGEGMLARDQLGVRSLFLREDSGRVSFATELRQLLALLPHSPGPDPLGIAHWITTSGRPGTGTLYQGVRRLSPGSMLLLNRDGVREERYWSLRYTEPLKGSDTEVVDTLRGAISTAVRRRLSPEGMTAVLMSGGLDSSSVAAMAAKLAPGAVLAYSAEFPEHPAVDESGLIEELRNTLSLSGATATVRAGGLLANAIAWIETWKAPLTSWGEFWCEPLLRSAATSGVRTVLGGDGGDELFGCRAYLMADRLRAFHPRDAMLLARELPGAGNRPSRRALLHELREFGVTGSLPALVHLRRGGSAAAPSWLRAQQAKALSESHDPLAWKRLDGPRWWAHDAHALTQGVEQLGLFENHRRRSAALGLETRHPVFDLDLVELAMRSPPASTFNRFYDRPLLRAAIDGLVPDVVRLRTGKALFDSLLMDCLTEADGKLTRELLGNPRAELAAYVDMGELSRTLLGRSAPAGPAAFRNNHQLWRLLTAECWLRAQHGSQSLSATPPSAPRVSIRPA